MMAPLHTLSKAGDVFHLCGFRSTWQQQHGLNHRQAARDGCCDNSAEFKINTFFHLGLLLVFSYYDLSESGQKNTIYKNN